MSRIWSVLMLLSCLCAILTGQTAELSASVLEGASAGVRLCISLAGPICLWSGISRLMEAAGTTSALSRAMAPFLRRLFPQGWSDREAREALCGNVSANLLGLGNAATPLGLRAVRRLRQLSGQEDASDELCRFIVLNTASIQLLPTTAAALRAGLGSDSPMDILPAVWVTSVLALTVGLSAAWLLRKWIL